MAVRLGIPPSKLDGRVPAETHRHIYSPRGRLVRTEVVREPEWTDQDRAEAIALDAYHRQMCPCGCGHRAKDTLSPEATGRQFVASRTVCRARLALLEAQEAATTAQTRHPGARLWSVEMR